MHQLQTPANTLHGVIASRVREMCHASRPRKLMICEALQLIQLQGVLAVFQGLVCLGLFALYWPFCVEKPIIYEFVNCLGGGYSRGVVNLT